MTRQQPTLFTKDNCGACKVMKYWLDRLSITYNEVKAFDDSGNVSEEYKRFAAPHNLSTVPVLAAGSDLFTTVAQRENIERVLGL